MCDDPHMKGFRGQTIDWSGIDGGWYCHIKDDIVDLHVNIRVTAPLPDEFPRRQLTTGVAILSEGHSLVIEAKDTYNISTDGCPRGISPWGFALSSTESRTMLSSVPLETRSWQVCRDFGVKPAGRVPAIWRGQDLGAHS